MIIIIILLYLCIPNSYNKKIKYDSWKDTVESFGDGTYQILHQVWHGENINILTNVAYNEAVITEIYNYSVNDEVVYFYGVYHSQMVYAALYVNDNLLKYYVDKSNDDFTMTYINNMLKDKQIELIESYNDFTEIEQDIFGQLK